MPALCSPRPTSTPDPKRSVCLEANASVRLHPALREARLFDDTVGWDVVLVAVSGNALHPRLLETPCHECSRCLRGVSMVPEGVMHSIAELDLSIRVRVSLKAGGADDGSACPLDDEPDAVSEQVRILAEQFGVEGQELRQLGIRPLLRQSCVE